VHCNRKAQAQAIAGEECQSTFVPLSSISSLGEGRDITGYGVEIPSAFNNHVRPKFGAQLVFSQDNVFERREDRQSLDR